MSTQQWIAVSAVAVPVAGWFITSALNTAREAKAQQRKQLAELYGPLVTVLIEGDQAWDECLTSLGWPPNEDVEDRLRVALTRPRDSSDGLSQEQFDTWCFWVEHAFFPRNEHIRQLIAEKAHLIEDSPAMTKSPTATSNSWSITIAEAEPPAVS